MATLALCHVEGFAGRLCEPARPDKARAVIPRDKEVDALNRQIYRELSSFMLENPAAISRCLNLMTVAKSLERVADHATNIAQEVVYLCEALDIRHEANIPPS